MRRSANPEPDATYAAQPALGPGEVFVGQERVQATYGENHPRLAAVKRKYDPGILFRVNQNTRPASA